MMQRFRSKPCVLVQPIAAGPRTAPSAHAERRPHVRAVRDLYGIRTCITQIDRAVIRAFLNEYYCTLTTSAAMAMTLRQESHGRWKPGGTLPAAFPTQPLPAALESKLSALPAGFERVMADRDVLLVSKATNEIVDVMTNASAPGGARRRSTRERRRARTTRNFRVNAAHDAAPAWRLFERNSIL